MANSTQSDELADDTRSPVNVQNKVKQLERSQTKRLAKQTNNNNDILKQFNESFHQSKADQIYRLLQDQESLNKVFKSDGVGKEEDSNIEDKSDDSLSEASMKDTEKRLAARLSLHKQKGGRSKTSMGFHNDAGLVISSDEDEDTNMVEEERPINTRINRPKSSYVRRRTMLDECDSNNNSTEYCDDSKIQRTSSFSRPPSRRALRGGGGENGQQRRMALKETNYNRQQNVQEQQSPGVNIVDSSNYEQFANTKNAVPTGLTRQRSRVRSFCENDYDNNNAKLSHSNELSNYGNENDNCQSSHQTMTRVETIALSPRGEMIVENGEDSRESPIQRHRRQQLQSARSSRPTSESVFMVRQRTESRLTNRELSSSSLSRPKSDKRILNSSSNKTVLSIDTNPNKSASPSRGYQGPQTGFHTQDRYQCYSGKMQGRPLSRSKSMRTDGPSARRGKNVAVYGPRGQPIGVMKLPPLDPSVSKRVDHSLVIAPGREAVV